LKTLARKPGLKRALAFGAVLLLVMTTLPAALALAQSLPQKTATPETPAQQPDLDPLGRTTPYGTVSGFVRAARAKDYARAAQYLDTKERGAAAEGLARQLQVVLDRGMLADLDRLSRKAEGELQDGLRAGQNRVGTVETRSGKVEILVERVERREVGPVWLFSPATLARIPAAAEELGAFNVETYLPRVLVDTQIFSFPLYRWIGMIVAFAVALVMGGLVTRALVPLLRRLLRRLTGEEDDRTLTSIKASIRLILIAAVLRLGAMLSTSLAMRQFWTRVAVTVGIIGLAWLAIQLTDIVSEFGMRGLRRRGMPAKIAMWNLARRLLRTAVVLLAALVLLHRAGADLTAILTGLGIGGIALALAAQKTLENLLGGITLVSDEPMRVGDFCRIGDVMGTIEDIGLRSTRIRTLSRTVVAVPNGQLSLMNVENFSVRDKFWFRHVIGVRYETTADQLRYVLAGVRSMLYSHPKVEQDGARIRLVGFGGSSLDLEIFAYVRATEMPEFLAIQEDLLLRIMDIVAEAGTGIAFPSQTTYLAKDAPFDSRKKEEALTRVRQWRERGDLPFPDFRPDQVGDLYDRLEYPPPGSSLRRLRPDRPDGETER